jgi:hypothetical protein
MVDKHHARRANAQTRSIGELIRTIHRQNAKTSLAVLSGRTANLGALSA